MWNNEGRTLGTSKVARFQGGPWERANEPGSPVPMDTTTPVAIRYLFSQRYQVNPVPIETPSRTMPPRPAEAKLLVVISPIVPPKPAPPVGRPSMSHF